MPNKVTFELAVGGGVGLFVVGVSVVGRCVVGSMVIGIPVVGFSVEGDMDVGWNDGLMVGFLDVGAIVG